MSDAVGHIVRVVLEHPVPVLFDYRCTDSMEPMPGQLVRVPFGKRYLVGVIWEVTQHSEVPHARLREVDKLWAECLPLAPQWRALATFAASYYQRSLGEVVLPALPQGLRDANRWPRLLAVSQIYRLLPAGMAALPATLPSQATAMRRLAVAFHEVGGLTAAAARALHPQAIKLLTGWQQAGWVGLEAQTATQEGEAAAALTDSCIAMSADAAPKLTAEQAEALQAINAASGFVPFLLHGVTGSGKTEVYLRALATLLTREPTAQALVLVPEINLTPQFEAFFRARLAAWPNDAMVTLHSGLAEGERARAWLAAHTGQARIVLGTRLAVLASLPNLALIIVDEEHDAAYKQQEKLRYSARDLAIWRAKQLNLPIVLGSATPSLETWRHAQLKHYTRLTLTQRAIAEAALPTTRLIDMSAQQHSKTDLAGLSQPLLVALRERLARGEQSLIFLNRRGYAPALTCNACGWVAGCVRCSVYVVLHKRERVMRCHHCGWHARIPHACAECGNIDLAPLGRGTQQLEEVLAGALPEAKILRIDADSTRLKGSAQALFASVSAGEVDILVGTQMIAKGHDFQRVTLVGVLNADAALFSHDFRASERLFAQLLQASGRAGRAGHGEVLIQTRYPQHPLYQALARHDYVGFAEATLAERQQARLPPFSYQALLRAEARTLDAALSFLARSATVFDALPGAEYVMRYEPVPMLVVKVMHVQRVQLLLESTSRSALQSVLSAWQPHLQELKTKDVLRWSIEVDPLEF